jgi:catecholate siderophore receptor
VLVDGQRVRGFETTASYTVDRWQVQAAMAWQNACLLADQGSALRAGARLAAVPPLTASLWSRWQLTPAWGAGLGLQHRGEVLAVTQNLSSPAADVVLPAFQRIDGALYWSASARWSVQLNVENLLDRRYFAAATNNFNILPGAPRHWRVGVTGHF